MFNLKKRCPKCKSIFSQLKHCTSEHRVKKYILFGECKVENEHWHEYCHCGYEYIREANPVAPEYSKWEANVIDEYKNMATEDIRRSVKSKTLPFSVLMSQIQGDFNFGNVIRTANFLGARTIFYYGKKRYNKVSAVGVYNYSDVVYLSSFEEIKELKSIYSFIGFENNIEKTNKLGTFDWNIHKENMKPPLIIIGEESCGIDNDLLSMCDHLIEISGRGSVRSLNAATAAAIAMYDFVDCYL